ncbi:MAG: hypothetical protein FK734_06150 [Asgard group archaeon]|nr:hypothetical protein [Asgard group archaeon]
MAFLTIIFFANIIAITTLQASAIDSNQISLISILAKGVDADISNAITFIEGKIEYDKNTGMLLGKVNFHLDIYNEFNEKIYTMKGELKDGMVLIIPFNYCPVRNVIWTDLWYVIGTGLLKTSDTILTIDYRGATIILPNTGGQYIPATIAMAISPYGEYVGGVWPDGPWAFAGLPGFGGVTNLLKYYEI